MNPITEEDLIAYQLGELSRWRAWQVRKALEGDAELAAEAEAIATTLRVFRDDGAAPVVDDAMLERTWQSVRPSLAVLTPEPKSATRVWAIATSSALAGALVVFAAMTFLHHEIRVTPIAQQQTVHRGGSVIQNAVNDTTPQRAVPSTDDVQQELHAMAHREGPVQHVNNRPGPLTLVPVDAVAEDPSLARHLDRAERVLTEVSHTDGALPVETQAQVHQLLLENAVYRTRAERRGDRAVAGVMDDLGRVLTVLDAEPQTAPSDDSDGVRLQMNLGGVLLDLRILHHNNSQNHSKTGE